MDRDARWYHVLTLLEKSVLNLSIRTTVNNLYVYALKIVENEDVIDNGPCSVDMMGLKQYYI
jgi:hypothetical protein